MAVSYTADVWCDCEGCAACGGTACSIWAPGVTGEKPPLKGQAREAARRDGFNQFLGKDYCRACWRELFAQFKRPTPGE